MTVRADDRDKVIIRTSGIGIGANLFLVVFKLVVGLASNSIAVILDAVNNLSDAASSLVTIIGNRLASKRPDKKHPLGYGRIEYLSAFIVAAIVFYAGITSLVESVKAVIEPEKTKYTTISFVIIGVAVAVKIVLGRYVAGVGKRVDSQALEASGADALFDAVLSLSVLLSALASTFIHIDLEAYVGAVISIFIIKAGLEMITDTVSELIGKRFDRDFLRSIKQTICKNEHVHGAYDLILHNYGHDKYIGSVHVEVDDSMTAVEIDKMQRSISEEVYRSHGVIMTGIGIYSSNSGDAEMRDNIADIVRDHSGVLQIHGFYFDQQNKSMSLDIILDYELEDRNALYEHIVSDIEQAYPDWKVNVTLDIDF